MSDTASSLSFSSDFVRGCMRPGASSCEDARNEGAFHHTHGHFRVLRVSLSRTKKNKSTLTAAFRSRLFGDKMEKWGGDLFYKKYDLLAKGFFTSYFIDIDTFYLFLNRFSTRVNDDKNISAVAAYTRV